MNRNPIVTAVVPLVTATVFMASCNGSSTPQPVPKDEAQTTQPTVAPQPHVLNIDKEEGVPWGMASVSGKKENLKEFDAKLKEVLGFNDLEEHEIGCIIGCEKFSTPDPLETIVYVFPRDGSGALSKFGEAWDQIQLGALDPGFKLEVESYVTPGSCNPVSDPPPCQDMPFCSGDQCGAKKPNGTPSCSLC